MQNIPADGFFQTFTCCNIVILETSVTVTSGFHFIPFHKLQRNVIRQNFQNNNNNKKNGMKFHYVQIGRTNNFMSCLFQGQ